MLVSQFFLPSLKDPAPLIMRAAILRRTEKDDCIWLPPGMRVLQNFFTLFQPELQAISAMAINLPAKLSNERENQLIYLLKKELRSFKSLPLIFYDWPHEIYSLHLDEESAQITQQAVLAMQQRIFAQLELNGDLSNIAFDYFQRDSGITVLTAKSQAVSLILQRFSINMPSLISTVIARHHDEFGIIWPENIAPFQVGIVPLQFHKSYRVRAAAEKCYQQLQETGLEVLMDDRKERPVVLFSAMDLWGIPHRLVITERNLDEGIVEYKSRRSGDTQRWPMEQISANLLALKGRQTT